MAATRRISVRLAGKEYPMTIPQAEEEKYRRAARDINSLIAVYKTRFMGMNREMTEEAQRLQKIEREIDDYLNNI